MARKGAECTVHSHRTKYYVGTFFRDICGDFLVRLETLHGVPQRGVQEIAYEMTQLSSRVLSYCMQTVTEHLGKLFFNDKTCPRVNYRKKLSEIKHCHDCVRSVKKLFIQIPVPIL